MKKRILSGALLLPIILIFGIATSWAVYVQCPTDLNGDGISDDPNVICMHITGGDGFAKMADGTDLYMFSFGLVDPATPISSVITDYTLKATVPAPLLQLKQGQELYLTMTNVGMVMRPDLFDPHSVHFHGFPNAAPIFDGLPEVSPTPIMQASYTWYYYAAVPGTYFYHCHVEAAEHMQMGMIGNAWILPAQDGTSFNYAGKTYTKFAYNDGDGSTGYDVAYPVQMTGFDSNFHTKHIDVQPLPFASMFDDYSMINGRGYPLTVNPNPITNNATAFGASENFEAQPAQSAQGVQYSGPITATAGNRVLLRVSNVSTTHLYAIATTLGTPMKVVGRGAAQLRGPTGLDTSMAVSVLNVAGGEAYDVMLDTTGVTPGTYFLYATTLENLCNGPEERGGIMTEIVIN